MSARRLEMALDNVNLDEDIVIETEELDVDINETETKEVIKEEEELDTDLEEVDDNEESEERKAETQEEYSKRVQKSINRATKQKHDALREAERYKREAEELKAKLNKQTLEQEKALPPLPDPLDSDYETKLKEREAVLLENERIRIRNKQKADADKKAAEKVKQTRLEQIQANHKRMYANASEYGVKPESLKAADELVCAYVKDAGTLSYILEHEKNTAIVAILGKNPGFLDRLSSMSTALAIESIATKVLPKVKGATTDKKVKKQAATPNKPTRQADSGDLDTTKRDPHKEFERKVMRGVKIE